jgi:hypothetical protein
MAVAVIEVRMFFSEEKNQKTFDSAQAYESGPWPDRWMRRRK